MIESKTVHYLHPDFDETRDKTETSSFLSNWIFNKPTLTPTNKNESKPTNNIRPSPLALLAETCKSIGNKPPSTPISQANSNKLLLSNNTPPIKIESTQNNLKHHHSNNKRHFYDSFNNNNSNNHHHEYTSKRIKFSSSSPSSTLSSNSSSSSTTTSYLFDPTIRSKVESTKADTSTPQYHFQKSKTSTQAATTTTTSTSTEIHEIKKLTSIASSILICLQQQLNNNSTTILNNGNHRNTNNDIMYILQKIFSQINDGCSLQQREKEELCNSNQDTSVLLSNKPTDLSNSNYENINDLSMLIGNKQDLSNSSYGKFNVSNGYHLDSNNNNIAKNGIKYCMYCGECIPYLPLLVAHIHSHVTPSSSSSSSSSTVSLIEFLLKLSPNYLTTNQNIASLQQLTNHIAATSNSKSQSTALFVNTKSPVDFSINNNNNNNVNNDNNSLSSSSSSTSSSAVQTSNFHNIHRLIY